MERTGCREAAQLQRHFPCASPHFDLESLALPDAVAGFSFLFYAAFFFGEGEGMEN